MNDIDRPITFRQLLTKCARVEVPLIQRDYAQGRETEKDVRESFLKALQDALVRVSENSTPPLNLDFVYGSMESGRSGSFFPLDGQQRLTTLLLLHWYLAWCDGQSPEFVDMLWDGKHSRFTYGVRPSSMEFFDELVRYVPDLASDEVPALRPLLEDQPWFFSHWRLDPTIQSALVMLEDIHQLFKASTGLFARLTDDEKPAITFHLLPLEHFGLTDDLYIKMNARGKPLTPFETFKARFEEVLTELFPTDKRKLGDGEVSVAEFFERRIDTQWTDFFWAHKSTKTNTFDDLIMNLLVALARVSLDPAGSGFNKDTVLLRERQSAGTFSLFHERGWLTRNFAENLISLLEAWSSDGGGKLAPTLPNSRYFDEAIFFQKAIKQPTSLDYTELIQFAAFVFFLRHHEGNIQQGGLSEWMRVIRNLSANSDIERPEEYGRCLAGLVNLLPHSAQILEHLSTQDIGPIGFSPQQVREEIFKAQLVLSNSAWRDRIDRAEEHTYFSGQIEFLLDFCGALADRERTPDTWDSVEHAELQNAFDRYLKKAQITFSSSGLATTKAAPESHLWKRALLTFGDYLLSSGSNSSFLTDPSTNWDSWKRFLRGVGGDKRAFLKALWDALDADADVEPQLKGIIANASDLEPWRAVIVKHPEVIAYCGLQEIRRDENTGAIYLLNKRQMNGNHAEIFSYGLYLELADEGADNGLAPLSRPYYLSVSVTDVEPHLVFVLERSRHRLKFAVDSVAGMFRIYIRRPELIEFPEIDVALFNQEGFAEQAGWLFKWVPREDIHPVLRQLAQCLANLPNQAIHD